MQLADFLSHDVDPSDPANRDPEFIRTVALPAFDALRTYYFRSEIEGVENVPRQRPFIAVANHNGGPVLPDCWVLVSYWWSALGPERPAYAMVHDAALRVPLLRTFLVKVGGLRASPENAEKVFGLGAPLLVYPGGELDCSPARTDAGTCRSDAWNVTGPGGGPPTRPLSTPRANPSA